MKSEIQAEIKQGLESGLTHQATFDLLKEKYLKNGTLLSDTLCKFPILSRKRKLSFLWIMLLALVLVLILFKGLILFVISNFLTKALNLVFITGLIFIVYNVARYKRDAFRLLGIVCLTGIVLVLCPVIFWEKTLNFYHVFSAILMLAVCVCSNVLYFKLFVKHEVLKVPVIYNNGQRGFEIQAHFIER